MINVGYLLIIYKVPDSKVDQPGEIKSARFELTLGEVNCMALLLTVV